MLKKEAVHLSVCLSRVGKGERRREEKMNKKKMGKGFRTPQFSLQKACNTLMLRTIKVVIQNISGICTNTVYNSAAAAAAKSLQSRPTLCDPIDGSPPGSAVPGILQARTLEWVAISFSNA